MMIPVCFRTDRRGRTPQVTAVFLDTKLNPVNRVESERECYAHVGQHGQCSIDWILNKTRPSTAEELHALLLELLGIYDSLLVHHRFTRKVRQL